MLIKFQLNINKIVKFLIVGNSFMGIADGLLAPIFAVFVVQKIAPGEIQVVGFAIAVYWLVKSVIQIPLSKYLDKTEKENDDLLALVIGSILFIIVPIFYIFIDNKYTLYLVQALHAIAGALYIIPWYAVFTRHADKSRIGFEWSLNSGALGFGIVIASLLSGLMAKYIGFNAVFIAASLAYLITSIIFIKLYLLLVKNHKDKNGKILPLMPPESIK